MIRGRTATSGSQIPCYPYTPHHSVLTCIVSRLTVNSAGHLIRYSSCCHKMHDPSPDQLRFSRSSVKIIQRGFHLLNGCHAYSSAHRSKFAPSAWSNEPGTFQSDLHLNHASQRDFLALRLRHETQPIASPGPRKKPENHSPAAPPAQLRMGQAVAGAGFVQLYANILRPHGQTTASPQVFPPISARAGAKSACWRRSRKPAGLLFHDAAVEKIHAARHVSGKNSATKR